jgi:Outer membrane protein beta-barrel domain
MDKHLHNGIGEQFSNEINKLNQQPRGHIWENIDKALDKTDAVNYKDKFTRLRKRSLLLLLLLIGISTFSVIYFSISKNKNTPQSSVYNDNLAAQKSNEKINNDSGNNTVIGKQGSTGINNTAQKQIVAAGFPDYATNNTEQEDLFSSKKLFINKKGKTFVKITNGNVTEEETTTGADVIINKNTNPEKTERSNSAAIAAKPKDAEKNLTKNADVSKKDSLPIVSNTQSSKSKKQQNNKAKFTLTAFAAPDYSAYRLENDERSNYDNKTGIEKRERSDISSTVGVLLGYQIGNKITIQSGITYSSSNISISPTKIYAEKNNSGTVKYRYNTSSGYGYILPSFSALPAVGDSLFANGANHTLRYISIPISLKYKLGNKKLTFNPGVGLTFNFLSKATLTTDVEDRFNRETEYITKLESIKKFAYSLILTPEVQYQLSKNWSITAMPYFKYSLGTINKGNVVKTYPYTFGLGIGVVYKF